jgi:hypothetical protein
LVGATLNSRLYARPRLHAVALMRAGAGGLT